MEVFGSYGRIKAINYRKNLLFEIEKRKNYNNKDKYLFEIRRNYSNRKNEKFHFFYSIRFILLIQNYKLINYLFLM